MKMTFVKITFAALLVTGLSAFAASTKTMKTGKTAHKAAPRKGRIPASDFQCVPLNVPYVLDESQAIELTEVTMLRNSIYAQYGYKFKNAYIAQTMVDLGCQNTTAVYNPTKLTAIDKQNVSMLKRVEAEMKGNQSAHFVADFKKATAAQRAEMISGNYCQLYSSKGDGSYIGIISFTSNGHLVGTVDGKGRVRDDGTSFTNVDSTTMQSFDTTSMYGLEFPAKGKWGIDGSGDLTISISPVGSNLKVTLTDSEYLRTSMLECTVAN
jgi:hypothetical protein